MTTSPDDIPFDIASLTETPLYHNYFVYGEPGAGKTRLAGSASVVPEMGKVLLIDVEGGTATLRSCYPNVDVLRVASMKKLEEVCTWLYGDGSKLYGTVILDSLTEIQSMDMSEIMAGVAAKSGSKQSEEVPSPREYLMSLNHMRKVVRAFRDAPMNCIVTCLADSGRDPDTGKKFVKPLLTGKFSTEVMAFFDEVFYLFVKDGKDDNGNAVQRRVMLTTTVQEIVAKDRSGKLEPITVEPTMQTIYEKITEGI